MDYVVIAIAIIAVVVWLTIGGEWAKFLVQAAVFIGFLPMAEGLILGTVKGHSAPWLIGFLANIFQILVLWFHPDGSPTWFAYVNSILIGVGVNLMIAYAARPREV